MNYKLNGLTVNTDGDDELFEIPNLTFTTKEEALTYIKDNISFQSYNEFKETLVLMVEGIKYHYVDLEPIPEEL